ncbi:hypothetical protein WAX78_04285 [Bacillus sp. FJAT-53711]|uniref:Resolvase HTH domain-containing protein n=1 Tax=Bacillus yunxiaonensis TaxID=3127665 RepID=A0ABU8FRU0_9BACI
MVVELYRSGQPVKQLSSEYGVSEVTISAFSNPTTKIFKVYF